LPVDQLQKIRCILNFFLDTIRKLRINFNAIPHVWS
jgi:hypothetical protein